MKKILKCSFYSCPRMTRQDSSGNILGRVLSFLAEGREDDLIHLFQCSFLQLLIRTMTVEAFTPGQVGGPGG